MKQKRIFLLMLVIAALCSGFIIARIGFSQPNTTTYQNPVFTPDLADPSIIKASDGYFYAYGTENNWQDGKPPHRIPIIRSKNLTQWTFVDDAFASKPSWKPEGGYLWAPDISLYNGTYYLYYAYSTWGDPNPGIGVATAPTPGGPFTDHGALFRSAEIGVPNSIDPMMFADDDGRRYLIWGSFHGIYGIELAPDGFTTLGDKFALAGNNYEAPYLVKRNGMYYLFLSSGSCCEGANSSYFVSVGRAEQLRGPYKNPIGGNVMAGPGALVVMGKPVIGVGRQFVGPGHSSLIHTDDGTDWLVYHAIDVAEPMMGDVTRRPLLIDPLIWKDGWPALTDAAPSTKPQTGPSLRRWFLP